MLNKVTMLGPSNLFYSSRHVRSTRHHSRWFASVNKDTTINSLDTATLHHQPKSSKHVLPHISYNKSPIPDMISEEEIRDEHKRAAARRTYWLVVIASGSVGYAYNYNPAFKKTMDRLFHFGQSPTDHDIMPKNVPESTGNISEQHKPPIIANETPSTLVSVGSENTENRTGNDNVTSQSMTTGHHLDDLLRDHPSTNGNHDDTTSVHVSPQIVNYMSMDDEAHVQHGSTYVQDDISTSRCVPLSCLVNEEDRNTTHAEDESKTPSSATESLSIVTENTSTEDATAIPLEITRETSHSYRDNDALVKEGSQIQSSLNTGKQTVSLDSVMRDTESSSTSATEPSSSMMDASSVSSLLFMSPELSPDASTPNLEDTKLESIILDDTPSPHTATLSAPTSCAAFDQLLQVFTEVLRENFEWRLAQAQREWDDVLEKAVQSATYKTQHEAQKELEQRITELRQTFNEERVVATLEVAKLMGMVSAIEQIFEMQLGGFTTVLNNNRRLHRLLDIEQRLGQNLPLGDSLTQFANENLHDQFVTEILKSVPFSVSADLEAAPYHSAQALQTTFEDLYDDALQACFVEDGSGGILKHLQATISRLVYQATSTILPVGSDATRTKEKVLTLQHAAYYCRNGNLMTSYELLSETSGLLRSVCEQWIHDVEVTVTLNTIIDALNAHLSLEDIKCTNLLLDKGGMVDITTHNRSVTT